MEKDFAAVPQTCACLNARRQARALTRQYDAALKPAGLTISQFSVLVGLKLAGPTPLQALAEAQGLERTTLTRNLRPLERDGLIRSVPGNDKRQHLFTLTQTGEHILAQAYPLWEKAQAMTHAQQKI